MDCKAFYLNHSCSNACFAVSRTEASTVSSFMTKSLACGEIVSQSSSNHCIFPEAASCWLKNGLSPDSLQEEIWKYALALLWQKRINVENDYKM